MLPAEFEEKDYEGPLYKELLFGNHRIATPGQVFENAFGIDAILEADHPIFWDIFGFPDIPRGIFLNHYRWGWVHRRYGRHRDLPNFEINLLIQAKRPDRLSGVNSALSRRGIKGAYWRFKIREHQQELLEKLEARLRMRALVVYASPAFHEISDLYTHTENQEVVENSTFVRPVRLQTHHCWNYDKPGCSGIATSEPESIEEPGFYDQLEKRLSQVESHDPKSSLKELDENVLAISKESKENPIAKHFLFLNEERFSRLREIESNRRQPLISFIKVYTFFELLNAGWLVAGNENPKSQIG